MEKWVVFVFLTVLAALALYLYFYLRKRNRSPLTHRKPISFSYNPQNKQQEQIVHELNNFLKKGYQPVFPWGQSAHLQSLYAFVLRRSWTRSKRPFKRHKIPLNGQEFGVDIGEPEYSEPTTPTVIVFPGIGGGSHNNYVRAFSWHCLKLGWRVAIFNWPGYGTASVAAGKLAPLGKSDEVEAIIDDIRAMFPESPLVAIGYSLGANALAKYVGVAEARCPLVAAISVCLAFNMAEARKRLQTTPSLKMYDNALLSKAKSFISRNENELKKMEELDIPTLLKARTMDEFDEGFTAKIQGCSAEQYYWQESSIRVLSGIKIPYMILNALDDPLIPESLVPYDMIAANPNIVLITTKYGGHLAWAEGVVLAK